MPLEYSEQADAALTSLEADPTKTTLLARVFRLLDRIEAMPGDADVRQHRLVDPAWEGDPTWVVVLATADEDWAIAWFPTPDPDVRVIAYIGPVPG